MQQLLAPAGHMESFFAAAENGADAVYLGLKQLSARASAANFTPEQLATLVPYAHNRGIQIHVALNSILTASELPGILDQLQSLSDIGVDALILQDPGIFFLALRHFPHVKLHASTLMAIHNHAGVRQLERLGAHRVVLARELTIEEIESIAQSTRLELEIFVHGALCYSYSGLCMASSFRGGHSGLQGRCVQPCRLRFRQGRKEGFFLSCNDLCALPLIPELKRLRIAAFKIEGRMKPAEYVAQVVKAYRLVLDASPDRTDEAVAQAQELLSQAPARRPTLGLLRGDGNREVLSPHRSGSSGLWIGTVSSVQEDSITIALRHDIRLGDRLRPESLEGKEKRALTITEIHSQDGKHLPLGKGGETVVVRRHDHVRPRERLFKVGSKSGAFPNRWEAARSEVSKRLTFSKRFHRKESVREGWPTPPFNFLRAQESILLKIGRAQDLSTAFQSPADRVLLTASKSNLENLARKRLNSVQKNRLVWSLPPLLAEKETDYYRRAVNWYREKGFRAWELNNWGHFDLFNNLDDLSLTAGHRFNLRNAAAVAAMAQAGCQWCVLSYETTREELQGLVREQLSAVPIAAVYSWPPLFTSRLIPGLQEEKPFHTPRGETYFLRKELGYASIYADRPVNWFEKLPVLRSYGYRFFLIDLSGGPFDQAKNIERIMNGFKRMRADKPYSLFNYDYQPVPAEQGDKRRRPRVKSEVRGRKPEVRGRRAEVRGRRAEGRDRKKG